MVAACTRARHQHCGVDCGNGVLCEMATEMNHHHLSEVWVYLAASPLLGLTATLIAYQVAYLIYAKCRFSPLANPVHISDIDCHSVSRDEHAISDVFCRGTIRAFFAGTSDCRIGSAALSANEQTPLSMESIFGRRSAGERLSDCNCYVDRQRLRCVANNGFIAGIQVGHDGDCHGRE